MPDESKMRVHVSWGPNQEKNARVRSVLQTLGMEAVSQDETATLYAERERRPPAPPGGRRVTVKG